MPKGRAQSNQRTEPTPCRRGGIPREFAPFKMEPANLSQGLDAMTAGTARRKELTHRERPAPSLFAYPDCISADERPNKQHVPGT